MAQIRKRTWRTKTGETRTAWQLSYYDKNGERHQQQFETKREADDERIRVEGQIARGVHVPDKRSLTVAQVGEAFLADFEELVESGKRSRETLRGYESQVRRHLKPLKIAKVKIARLSGPDCTAYARTLERSRSDDLAGKVFSTFRQIVDFAWGNGWVGSNPARAVSIRKAPDWEADQEVLEIPTMEVLKTLLGTARDFDTTGRAEAFIRMLLFQALRVSEVRALSKTHLTLRGPSPEIRVRRRADRWSRIQRVKTKTSNRSVPMGAQTVSSVRRWLLKCPSGGERLIFPNGAGNVESYANLYHRLWIPLLEKAELLKDGELPPFSIHSLRHAGISLWIRNGASPKQVQTWAGHASIQTTWDIYGHLWREHQDEQAAANASENALSI